MKANYKSRWNCCLTNPKNIPWISTNYIWTVAKMLDPSRTNSIGRKGILKTSNASSNNAGNTRWSGHMRVFDVGEKVLLLLSYYLLQILLRVGVNTSLKFTNFQQIFRFHTLLWRIPRFIAKYDFGLSYKRIFSDLFSIKIPNIL